MPRLKGKTRATGKPWFGGGGFLTVYKPLTIFWETLFPDKRNNATISDCVAGRKDSVTEKSSWHYACLAKAIRLQPLERRHASGGETCGRYRKYG